MKTIKAYILIQINHSRVASNDLPPKYEDVVKDSTYIGIPMSFDVASSSAPSVLSPLPSSTQRSPNITSDDTSVNITPPMRY